MRWPFLVALLGGCYSPSIAPCFLACAQSACPDNLVCNAQGMCARSEADVCSMGGGPDAGDAVPSCGWPAISNVDPCALEADQATTDIDISAAVASINTDTLSSGGIDNLVLSTATQLGTPNGLVTVAAVRTWRVRAGSLLTIEGKRPLIILANDSVLIEGNIRFAPSVNDLMCPTRGGHGANTTSLAGGGGGGGGGFAENTLTTGAGVGGTGGPYAANAGGSGGQPGDTGGTDNLRPLRPGCQGGRGGVAGTPTPILGGVGGFGGGAIQISAVDTIRVIGGISAPGGGGEAGSPDTAAARSGAGGGGSGGAILLEAPNLELVGASLCANGGGGGGTGSATATGQDATCTNIPAPGGPGSNPNDGVGGTGATGGVSAQQGRNGGTETGTPMPPSHGGGGGGGAVGRIRLNGVVVGAPMIATPTPTTGSL